MGTDAGIEFKAESRTVRKMRKLIPKLDAITNEGCLGVSCTPLISKDGDKYRMVGQTHWSYDGTNGRQFVAQIKAWAEVHELDIEVIDEWYA
jgi:hypothetical protein